jgi:hypothetical protein
MKHVLSFFLLLFSTSFCSSEEAKSFRDLQWKFPRVRTAAAEKDVLLRERFQAKGLPYPPHAILLRAFKREAPFNSGPQRRRTSRMFLFTNTAFALRLVSSVRRGDSVTSKSPRVFTSSTGSIHKAISF